MRILLCEDEPELSNALVAILKGNNYSVDAVYNGLDAVAYIESEIYDAVILDIMMPKLDGISVLKEIRLKGNNVPVIMLTAKAEIEDKVQGLDLGADDYLTKPFEIKELLARLRSITRRQSNIVDNVLSFGNIKLNTSTFELYTNEKSIKLVGKEFQILEMLMRNPSKLISVENFMDKIWGYDSDADTNVVWVYISNLRKKLNSLNSNVEIKVSRNLGYSLEVVGGK